MSGKPPLELLLCEPRGFCAGVVRAIDTVERALANYGAPVYVRHEIVHNAYVVDDLRNKGAVFVEDLSDVPSGSHLVFSAHGVSRAIKAEAEARGLKVFDATCPLVTKVHVEVAKMREENREIIMIGHQGHPEVEGTMGQSDNGMYLVETVADVQTLQVKSPDRLAYVSQTTLSVDDTTITIAVSNSGAKDSFIRSASDAILSQAFQEVAGVTKKIEIQVDSAKDVVVAEFVEDSESKPQLSAEELLAKELGAKVIKE